MDKKEKVCAMFSTYCHTGGLRGFLPLVFMRLCSKFPSIFPSKPQSYDLPWPMRISKDDTSRSSKSACILGPDFLECFFHGSQPLRCKEPWTRLLNQRRHRDRRPGGEDAILNVQVLASNPGEFSCSRTTQVDQSPKLWCQKSYCPSKLATLSGFLLSHPQKLAFERGDLQPLS